MNYINLNGKILEADKPALLVSNRGYRYGDGLFETIKVFNKKILLEQYHFERLFSGISLLQIEMPKLFNSGKLKDEMLDLCKKNKCDYLARVRVSVSRGNGGLYDEDRTLQYVIECWPLNESVNRLNENGLVIDIYAGIKKSCDIFSNLKSANFLPYSIAAGFAKENKLNDCLVLNANGNITDSTIANIFIIKEEIIITPALSEGCVNGVMRKYLLEKLRDTGFKIKETSVFPEDVENADEIFLTNAIKGMQWVKQFRNKIYTNKIIAKIYNQVLVNNLWQT
jgi:branched-chain amino acid aminotransferase